MALDDPSAYVRSDDVNSVVYRGIDGHINELYLSRGGAAWKTGDLTGATGAVLAGSKPYAYTRADNYNSVVYRGIDNHIHELFLSQGGAAWGKGDLTALTGGPAAGSDPAPFVRSDGYDSLMFWGTDNQLYELSLAPGSNWGVNNMTLLAGNPPR
jgi:hypothetical protein